MQLSTIKTGQNYARRAALADSIEQKIIIYLATLAPNVEITAAQILAVVFDNAAPVGNVRHALINLAAVGELLEIENHRHGAAGQVERAWIVPTGQMVLI